MQGDVPGTPPTTTYYFKQGAGPPQIQAVAMGFHCLGGLDVALITEMDRGFQGDVPGTLPNNSTVTI